MALKLYTVLQKNVYPIEAVKHFQLFPFELQWNDHLQEIARGTLQSCKRFDFVATFIHQLFHIHFK